MILEQAIHCPIHVWPWESARF